jgi:hypothetical protein
MMMMMMTVVIKLKSRLLNPIQTLIMRSGRPRVSLLHRWIRWHDVHELGRALQLANQFMGTNFDDELTSLDSRGGGGWQFPLCSR